MGLAEVECARPGCRTFTGDARLLLLLLSGGKSRVEGRPCLGDPNAKVTPLPHPPTQILILLGNKGCSSARTAASS